MFSRCLTVLEFLSMLYNLWKSRTMEKCTVRSTLLSLVFSFLDWKAGNFGLTFLHRYFTLTRFCSNSVDPTSQSTAKIFQILKFYLSTSLKTTMIRLHSCPSAVLLTQLQVEDRNILNLRNCTTGQSNIKTCWNTYLTIDTRLQPRHRSEMTWTVQSL